MPLLVVGVRLQERVEAVRVARRVNTVEMGLKWGRVSVCSCGQKLTLISNPNLRIGDLLEVERERLASLVGVVEAVLDHEGETAPDERTGARLARRRHETRHALVGLDVRDRAVELPHIPLEVELLCTRPGKHAIAPKLCLVDNEKVQNVREELHLVRAEKI